jgi:hypothetical protein
MAHARSSTQDRSGAHNALPAATTPVLVIIWRMLATDTPYTGLGPEFYDHRADPDRETRRLITKLQALGHTVTITPAA